MRHGRDDVILVYLGTTIHNNINCRVYPSAEQCTIVRICSEAANVEKRKPARSRPKGRSLH
ncbi:predicted protein [Plenodomus lingam JN3]|uniref:Predicted protein n=1 Tax=Leptosphaeria maculans (strain JN3 / isolate v23.1.3 / race Av1-4-5-6-7-8) TaxID=985895 RepID=E4ZQU0_LEPMJ|nr:predicted protein [Plenodomus lingam JN3]CBX94095.1 predicted protein [Plenodomus lingam JN3]